MLLKVNKETTSLTKVKSKKRRWSESAEVLNGGPSHHLSPPDVHITQMSTAQAASPQEAAHIYWKTAFNTNQLDHYAIKFPHSLSHKVDRRQYTYVHCGY